MRCPKCGSYDLVLLESFKKRHSGLWLLFLIPGWSLVVVGLFLFNWIVELVVFLVVVSVSVTLRVLKYRNNRRSHTKVVCKTCSYFWYIN